MERSFPIIRYAMFFLGEGGGGEGRMGHDPLLWRFVTFSFPKYVGEDIVTTQKNVYVGS